MDFKKDDRVQIAYTMASVAQQYRIESGPWARSNGFMYLVERIGGDNPGTYALREAEQLVRSAPERGDMGTISGNSRMTVRYIDDEYALVVTWGGTPWSYTRRQFDEGWRPE